MREDPSWADAAGPASDKGVWHGDCRCASLCEGAPVAGSLLQDARIQEQAAYIRRIYDHLLSVVILMIRPEAPFKAVGAWRLFSKRHHFRISVDMPTVRPGMDRPRGKEVCVGLAAAPLFYFVGHRRPVAPAPVRLQRKTGEKQRSKNRCPQCEPARSHRFILMARRFGPRDEDRCGDAFPA
jgi:hypothetical protein